MKKKWEYITFGKKVGAKSMKMMRGDMKWQYAYQNALNASKTGKYEEIQIARVELVKVFH